MGGSPAPSVWLSPISSYRVVSANTSLWLHAMYLGMETEELWLPSGYDSHRRTRRSGSRNGSGRRITLSTTEKIAVLAPIPRASAATATAVNPGLRRMERTAYRTSDANVARSTPYIVFNIFTPGGSSNRPPDRALLTSTVSEYIWKMRSPLRSRWMS